MQLSALRWPPALLSLSSSRQGGLVNKGVCAPPGSSDAGRLRLGVPRAVMILVCEPH
jgi:hypothetical protein